MLKFLCSGGVLWDFYRMSPLFSSIGLFAAGLALTLISSLILSRTLEKICGRFNLSDGLMGAVVAFGANMPELSSAIIALVKGKNELGVGVILGSNIFNLAAILGLSTLVSGVIIVDRKTTLISGGVSILMASGVLFLMTRMISPEIAVAGMVLVFVWYLFKMNTLPPKKASRATGESSSGKDISKLSMAAVIPLSAAVILGSAWMIDAIETVGEIWRISHLVLGSLILAGVTGLPNVSAAIALARRGKGTAVVNEAFSSNNLNLLFGLSLPAAIIGFSHPGAVLILEAWIFAALTLFSATVLFFGKRLYRWGAIALIAGYGFFVFVIVS